MRRIALLTCLATLVPAGSASASFTQDTASHAPDRQRALQRRGGRFRRQWASGSRRRQRRRRQRHRLVVHAERRRHLVVRHHAHGAGDGADTSRRRTSTATGARTSRSRLVRFPDGGVGAPAQGRRPGFMQDGRPTIAMRSANTVAAGDLNGDHKTDLASATPRSSGPCCATRATPASTRPSLSSPGRADTSAASRLATSIGTVARISSATANPARVEIWLQKAGGGFTLARSSEINTGAVTVDSTPRTSTTTARSTWRWPIKGSTSSRSRNQGSEHDRSRLRLAVHRRNCAGSGDDRGLRRQWKCRPRRGQSGRRERDRAAALRQRFRPGSQLADRHEPRRRTGIDGQPISIETRGALIWPRRARPASDS